MTVIDIVEFEIGSERYALDITLTREIVEMVPITPVPRAPAHIAGIINLRGEITNIINLNKILDLPETSNKNREDQKIIVLVPEAAEGSNTGIIVDDVHAALQINGSGNVAAHAEGEGAATLFGDEINGLLDAGGVVNDAVALDSEVGSQVFLVLLLGKGGGAQQGRQNECYNLFHFFLFL